MAKIKVLDFAKNVEFNRKRLIQNARSKGKYIQDDANLDSAVTINNTIVPAEDESVGSGCRVRYIDIDGTDLKPNYYVDYGSAAVAPPNPNYDSDILEFVEWAQTSDTSQVIKNIDCGAIYAVKPDENGRRWTHLFCDFNSYTGLSISIKYNKGISSSILIIDWGDGVVDEISSGSSGTQTHEYSAEGNYLIKLWCDYSGWYISGGLNANSIFGSAAASKGLLRAYLGENIKNLYSLFAECSSLQVVSLPNTLTGFENNSFNKTGLTAIIVPSSVTYIGNTLCWYCYNLKYFIVSAEYNFKCSSTFESCFALESFIVPETTTNLNGTFHRCSALEEIIIPKSVKIIDESTFQGCSKLKHIIFENESELEAIKSNSLTACPLIESINFENCNKLNAISSNIDSNALKKIVIPNTMKTLTSGVLGTVYNLEDVELYSDFDFSISFKYAYRLRKESIINIAKWLKDNSGLTAKSISFSTQKHQAILNRTHIDEVGDIVDYDTEGAVSLLEYIQNKNWTVSFG